MSDRRLDDVHVTSGGPAGRRRAFIVANVVPRWVSDFNVVSTQLVAAGYDVTLYASAPSRDEGGFRSTDIVERERQRLDPAVRVEFLPYSTVRIAPVAFLRNFLLAFKLARRHPDALFILWTSIPNLTWGPALRLLRRRVVYLVTGLGPVFASIGASARRRFVVEQIERVLFRSRRCRILVHNADDKAFLCDTYGLPRDRVVVTGGCGVDPDEFPFSDLPPRSADAPVSVTGSAPEATGPIDGSGLPRPAVPVVLVPVRLLVDKGVLDAAAASARLAAAGVAHEMWFTSNLDPSHPTAITADDRDRILRTTPTVRFLGYVPSLLDAYRACTVACIPTYFPEGLPTALLEAASMGRPIVTCDNVGCRDFIRDGVDGRVVPPRSPGALAEALEQLLTRPDDAERMRRSAHERFLGGYTKQHMLDLTVATIAELGFPVEATEPQRSLA